MKKFTSTIAALFIVIITMFASTGETQNQRATVVEIRGNIFKVFYTEAEAKTVTIRLKDENGKVIRQDFVTNRKGFMKPYDLSNLKCGTYSFEMKDKFGTLSQEIHLKRPQEELLAVRTLCENRYQLLVEQPNCQSVKVSILKTDGDTLHKETIASTTGFSKVYDLSKFDSENFVFKISDKSSTRLVSVE